MDLWVMLLNEALKLVRQGSLDRAGSPLAEERPPFTLLVPARPKKFKPPAENSPRQVGVQPYCRRQSSVLL